MAKAKHPKASWFLAFISFIESSVFPIPPDIVLILMIISNRAKSWIYAIICTASSVLGGIVGYLIGDLVFTSQGTEFMSLDISTGPTSYRLYANYPNPFNPTTTIRFDLPYKSGVSIKVYNLQGREVMSLIDGNMEAGYHSVSWNAESYSSGMYFVKMLTGDFIHTQKMMLIK